MQSKPRHRPALLSDHENKRGGPRVLGNFPRVAGLSKAFKDAIEKKAGVLVDVRNMLAFGGGHIALNIGSTPILYLGRLDARSRKTNSSRARR
jgi:hydroxyacylglutathione hydrolase